MVDNTFAYSGSTNIIGTGMGAKSEHRKNFESGFITSMNYDWANSAGLANGNDSARSSAK
ncbi:MAG TPA: hypothetical protein DCP92_13510 [Nitrospiraceae bacterium]|nr:hypothetical protein [Nitrospiraceae bacterium]